MSYVQNFQAVTPPARYDAVAWTEVEIEEAATEAGPFVLIDTQAVPVDATPQTPNTLTITTSLATLAVGRYRFRFTDGDGNVSAYSSPVLAPAGTATGPAGPLSLETLKRYLNITGASNDLILEEMLNAAYAFAMRYTGRTLVMGIDPDFADAIYTHAARNYRERDAMYADQVALTDDGAVVNYFRSMPPRVKAVYDMVKVLSPAEAYMS